MFPRLFLGMLSIKRHLTFLGIFTMLCACNEQTVRRQGFEVHGIDVSHYQKQINWPAVAAQDIRFTFVKATEGETMQDTFFCKNWSGAKAAGIKRGAYHFFRPALSAEAQAQNFLGSIHLENGDLAPVLDVEVLDGMEGEALRQGIRTWLRTVEDFYKIKPILYTNQKFFNQHLAGHFPGYPIWIARYSSWRKPALRSGHGWHFWQYGNRGRLQGIVGNVDLNVFSGSMTELEDFCLKRYDPLFLPPVPESVAANP